MVVWLRGQISAGEKPPHWVNGMWGRGHQKSPWLLRQQQNSSRAGTEWDPCQLAALPFLLHCTDLDLSLEYIWHWRKEEMLEDVLGKETNGGWHWWLWQHQRLFSVVCQIRLGFGYCAFSNSSLSQQLTKLTSQRPWLPRTTDRQTDRTYTTRALSFLLRAPLLPSMWLLILSACLILPSATPFYLDIYLCRLVKN